MWICVVCIAISAPQGRWKIMMALCMAGLVVPAMANEPNARQNPADAIRPPTTVKNIMNAVIAPQSDVLWSPGEPKTDGDWLRLENAAIAIQVAGSMLTVPSTDRRDREYQRLPVWNTLTSEMRKASISAMASIRSRDLDALFVAGNDLYTPCETCHRATYQQTE